MSLQAAIYQRLTTDLSLTALGGRFYPIYAKEKVALPFLVFTVTEQRPHDALAAGGVLLEADLQIEIVGDKVFDVCALQDAVYESLKDLRYTHDNTMIDNIRWISSTDQAFIQIDDASQPVFGQEMRFVLWFRRS